MSGKKKLLILNTGGSPLLRLPEELLSEFEVELFPIDRRFVNGHGAYQKLGFRYAIDHGFDIAALAPVEFLTQLVRPLIQNDAEAVFGSSMKGGPLSWIQNRLLHSNVRELQARYRIYSVVALTRVPFDLNTDDLHFETEISLQLLIARQRIAEMRVPTTHRTTGMKHAWNTVVTTLKCAVQSRGILYDRKFDCAPDSRTNAYYTLKLGYKSPHSLTLSRIPSGARVLELGCAGGHVGAKLRGKGCKVTGMDLYPLAGGIELDSFRQADLNRCELPDGTEFEFFIMLDVIEHLHDPEEFMDRLRNACRLSPNVRIIISTGNVAFFIQRALLMLGQFNYGKRGILDRTHTRLFTFSSIKALLVQSRFEVLEEEGIPAPFPLAFQNRTISGSLLAANNFLIRFSKTLFAYQIYIVAKPRPGLEYLLRSHQGKVKT